jgi:predicted Rossmann fold flavoprotein
MNTNDQNTWDVVVIGGGPAAMMSAGQAAERGLKVLLLEKNNALGQKLLITGGGRCNVTNAESDLRTLLSKYKGSDKFLFSAFSEWDNMDSIKFFNNQGVRTKIEAENRVFPSSDSSLSIWNALVEYMKKYKVEIASNSPVIKLIMDQGKIKSVLLKNGKEIGAHSFILATGGKSRPETGSTGDGFIWLKELGHTINQSSAALVPIATKDAWVKKLAGISLPQVKISIIQDNIKQDIRKGKVLFTHFGLSGPTILNMSRDISELLKYGKVYVSIDLLPRFDHGELNKELQNIFTLENTKKLKNSLSSLIPQAIAKAVLEQSGVDGEISCHSISRQDRLKLIESFKDMRTEISGLLGVEKAVITSGGVSLEEIDFKTMRSKLYPNLHIVGDLLDIDRPSGGYSLQLCWTTGYIAGKSAI